MFYDKPLKWVTEWDQFTFNSYTALLFNKKKTFNTFPGGMATLFIYSVFAYYWCLQFYQMFYYQ